MKKSRTKEESRYLDDIASLCCVVCRRNLGIIDSPACVHHIRTGYGVSQRAPDIGGTIPLCPQHHTLGGYGVAYHAGAEEFERLYGTELELLEYTHWLLQQTYPTRRQ